MDIFLSEALSKYVEKEPKEVCEIDEFLELQQLRIVFELSSIETFYVPMVSDKLISWKRLERDLMILENEPRFSIPFKHLINHLISFQVMPHDLWTPWTSWLMNKNADDVADPNNFVLQCTTTTAIHKDLIKDSLTKFGFNLINQQNQATRTRLYKTTQTIPSLVISYPYPFNPGLTITNAIFGYRKSNMNTYKVVGYSMLNASGVPEKQLKSWSRRMISITLGEDNIIDIKGDGTYGIFNIDHTKFGNIDLIIQNSKLENSYKKLWKPKIFESLLKLPDNVPIQTSMIGTSIVVLSIDNKKLKTPIIIKPEFSCLKYLKGSGTWMKYNVVHKKRLMAVLTSTDFTIPEFIPKSRGELSRLSLYAQSGNPYCVNASMIL